MNVVRVAARLDEAGYLQMEPTRLISCGIMSLRRAAHSRRYAAYPTTPMRTVWNDIVRAVVWAGLFASVWIGTAGILLVSVLLV